MIRPLAFLLTILSCKHATSFLECRHTEYITEEGKLYAVDPVDRTAKFPLKIKGLGWKGMEGLEGVPGGLWGTMNTLNGAHSTSVDKVVDFFEENKFNSLRLPLNVDYINENVQPRFSTIHQYENQKIVTEDKYVGLIGKMVEIFQEKRVTVLLDLHKLSIYEPDALWYLKSYTDIEDTPTYAALQVLTKQFCNEKYWNILGVDLKNEPMNALWGDKEGIEYDWKTAAQGLAEMVISECPQWLVFVQGAGVTESFNISDSYDVQVADWPGSNFRNASENPIELSRNDKLVYAPHAHTQGKEPKPYFFKQDPECSSAGSGASRCVDFDNGEMLDSRVSSCDIPSMTCNKLEYGSKSEVSSVYGAVLDKAFGYLNDKLDVKVPLVMGAFGGVYGKHQPEQTKAMDVLISYIVENMEGGYYTYLNPTTDYLLENELVPGEEGYPSLNGTLGRTHYGLMQAKDWTKPHADFLEALGRIPSSEIPCFGAKLNSTDGESSDVDRSAPVPIMFMGLVWCICTFVLNNFNNA